LANACGCDWRPRSFGAARGASADSRCCRCSNCRRRTAGCTYRAFEAPLLAAPFGFAQGAGCAG
jgi:hypothetical protein